jgi:hypothetical protein
MKQQAIQYLAFDVHQATIVGVARDEKGAIVLRATIPTEARAILQLVNSAGSRGHVAFEEGTQAQWLHDLLVPHAEKVIVCNTRGSDPSANQERSFGSATTRTRSAATFPANGISASALRSSRHAARSATGRWTPSLAPAK